MAYHQEIFVRGPGNSIITSVQDHDNEGRRAVIFIEDPKGFDELKLLLQRGMGTWDNPPKWMTWLADHMNHGRSLDGQQADS